jgi:KDO2-lipid IV(A) lauroyltransferase
MLPALRAIATKNVERALPEVASARCRARLVRRVYRELGALLGDTVATLHPKRAISPLPFLPGARACLDEALAEGRGVVFASAHLGPWERVASSIVAAGIPLTVLAREPYDPRLARIYERLRGARGVRTIYRGASSAGIALARVLRKGGVLGIPMDLASRVPSIEVPFLGLPAPTPIGPARLALRMGSPVIVGSAVPTAGGAVGISFTRIEIRPSTEGSPETDAHALTVRINEELSARIRAFPEAWPWMHSRWR